MVHAGNLLNKEDLIGSWVSTYQDRFGNLVIADDLSAQWFHKSGSKAILASFDDIQFFDDLMIITFPKEINPTLNKMVLGGWKNIEEKKIFGTLYMYLSKSRMITGTPISLRKE